MTRTSFKILKTFAILMFASLSFSFILHPTSSKELSGVYYSPNKKSKIEFTKKDGLYYGKLIWNDDIEIIDDNNLNEKLRNRKLVGTNIFFSLKYNTYLKLWIGKFYDPTSGEIFDCNLWLTNTNKTLMARGYLESSFISRTETLQRVSTN